MAQNQQHGEQSIGSGQTQDGIQGTPSGTEGATSGQGIDKGEKRDPGARQSTQDHGNRQAADNDTYQRNDLWRDDEGAGERSDSQQSAQREGMGNHQQGNRQGQGPDMESRRQDTGNLHSDKTPNRER